MFSNEQMQQVKFKHECYAWIPLQVAYSTFQINPILMAVFTFYQYKDDHYYIWTQRTYYVICVLPQIGNPKISLIMLTISIPGDL